MELRPVGNKPGTGYFRLKDNGIDWGSLFVFSFVWDIVVRARGAPVQLNDLMEIPHSLRAE